MNGPPPKSLDEKNIHEQNQEQIRADVDKLFSLVSQLKQELSVSNTSSVLTVSFVQDTKEIEKLAKQIRDLARG